jgi:DnaJ domain
MDPYTTLGLNHTATLSTIKRTYRHLALLHHPDHNSSTPQAHKEFVRIQCAYEELLHLHPLNKQNHQDQGVCTDPALDTYPIWYEDIPYPSFKHIKSLLVHLRFNAQDLWEQHGELLCLLKRQRQHQQLHRGEEDEYGYGYGYGYEGYTNTVGQVVSNLRTESEGLEGRCGELNGDAYTETSRWSSPGNMRKVEALQGELTTYLNSVGFMWKENEEVKGVLDGKEKVSDEEWEVVLEILREMAHAPPL